jgi:hypothetical protein
MTALLIGYARVSTDAQDLTAQREGLLALGVDAGRIHVDHGLLAPRPSRRGNDQRNTLPGSRPSWGTLISEDRRRRQACSPSALPIPANLARFSAR